MSKESTTPDVVELTRRSLEAANRRDVDAILSFFAARFAAERLAAERV
jgi:hypothetical protein